MKKLLITGENSYVSNELKKYIVKKCLNIKVENISLKNEEWKKKDFSDFDAVIHLAALVHKNEKKLGYDDYEKVNVNLTRKLMDKCKKEGLNNFIFMSTMSVYGIEGSMKKVNIITKETLELPTTYYGISKLKAEKILQKNSCNKFIVTILRPPMIYGENCPGNYRKLERLSKKTPIFPYIKNSRSAIHIEHLCEIIVHQINEPSGEIMLVQDKEYMNTTEEVKKISKKYNHKIYFSKKIGKLVIYFGKNLSIVKKIFGNLIYEIN